MNELLVALIVLMQIADAWTTNKALKQRGLVEGNAFMQGLMDKLGVRTALWLTKLATAGLSGLLYVLGETPWLGILTVVYAATVINNIRHLKKVGAL